MNTTIARLLPEYILTLRHKGRTEATLRAYACDLRAAGAVFPHDITAISRVELEAWLAEAQTASTQARKLASLRTFFAWCLARDLIPRDPTLGLEARRTTRRLPRPVNGDTDRTVLDLSLIHISEPTRPY